MYRRRKSGNEKKSIRLFDPFLFLILFPLLVSVSNFMGSSESAGFFETLSDKPFPKTFKPSPDNTQLRTMGFLSIQLQTWGS